MNIQTEWFDLAAQRKAYADEAAKTGQTYSRKAVDADDVDLQVDDGEVVAVVSTNKIDAVGDIVLPKGVDLTRFRKTRQVYFEHNMNGLALGAAKWIKATDTNLISKYFISKATEFQRAIGDMVKEGVYRSHSIGFLSRSPSAPTSQELRFHPEWKGAASIHRDTLLLEFSLVGQPCNDEALALAVAKGYSRPTIDLLSGRTYNSQQAAAEVVTEVKRLEAEKNSAITQKELSELLAKKIEERYALKRVSPDSVVVTVMRKLYASR